MTPCGTLRWLSLVVILCLTATLAYVWWPAPAPRSEPTALDLADGRAATAFLRQSGPTVLMVYADWCPHCRSTKPNFVRAAAASPAQFALLNGDAASEFVRSHGIRGYPHIVSVDADGGTRTYTGDRSVASLVEFSTDNRNQT